MGAYTEAGVKAGNHKCNTGSTLVSYNLLEQLLWPKAEINSKAKLCLTEPLERITLFYESPTSKI